MISKRNIPLKGKVQPESGKMAWFLTFTGILLLSGSFNLGNSLVLKIQELNGDYSLHKVVVSVKNQLDHHGQNAFTLEDRNNLSAKFNQKTLTFIAPSGATQTPVVNGNISTPANIIGTDDQYPKFHQIKLSSGSFFTKKAEEEGEAVAVIENTLAWSLFKNENAVGRKVMIYDTPFSIVGVIEKDKSIIQTLTDDRIPDILIPAEKLLELDSTAKLTCFEVTTPENSIPGQNTADVSSILGSIGKDPANYGIIDFTIKGRILEQKPLGILFGIGLISILILASYWLKTFKDSYRLIKTECQTNDWRNLFKSHSFKLSAAGLQVLFISAGIALLWAVIRFKVYIPPRYIPDELINISYYTNLFRSSIAEKISEMGYIALPVELMLNMTDSLVNLGALIPALMAMILLYTGISRLCRFEAALSGIVLRCGIQVLISLALVIGMIRGLGLPALLPVKGVLLSWALIFFLILKIHDRKEREL